LSEKPWDGEERRGEENMLKENKRKTGLRVRREFLLKSRAFFICEIRKGRMVTWIQVNKT
jgi:hypothetical protein